MGDWSRRQVILGAAAAGVAVMGGRSTPAAQSAAGAARAADTSGDLVLVNGRFVDGRGEVAAALTVRNGRIAAIGTAPAVAPSDAPHARTIDLGGRTVIPGLFDAHAHYTRAGVNPGHEARRVERAFSIGELQEAIARRAASVPRGAFVTCIGGWNHTQLAEARRPTKAELDAAAPAHAVYLSGTGGGTGAIANRPGAGMAGRARRRRGRDHRRRGVGRGGAGRAAGGADADGGLYASVTLPNLIVGTVGGGTGLPSQKACLDILGLSGSGHARAFAEVAAARC